MSLKSDWHKEAICLNHDTPSLWLSSNIEDLNYARNLCVKCPSRMPCIYDAIYNENFVGVRGGITEYEYLSRTWVEVEDVEETNWPKTDRIIQRLLRDFA